MLRVRPFTPGDREAWDAYVLAHPDSHFGQRIAWCELTAATHRVRPRHWLAEEAGRVRGVLPLFARGGRAPLLFSAPGGLLADDAGVAGALLEPARAAVRDERLAMLELRDQRRAWPDLATSDEHVTLVLPLAPTPEAQWAALGAKLRNQVRKGGHAGFEPRWGHDGLAGFHRVLLENMRDLGTPIRGRDYFRRALAALGGAAELLVLRRGGEPAAAMFTVRHRDALADPWASARRRFLADCPNMVLYWEAIRRAIAGGARAFDMGRSQWDSGTFRFKAQWGAAPVPLHYQYVLGTAAAIPTLAGQKRGFALAVRAWRRLPLPLAAVLGEPAKRMFPEVL